MDCLLSLVFCLSSAPVAADPPPASPDAPASAPDALRTDITVVATGSRSPLSALGQSVAVAGEAEIAAVQGPDLTRVLERLPGVTLTRNGGLGSFTGVRVRGSDAEQVLVLIDGVRVNDVSSPGGGFDFGNLLTGGIGKIELLRGSNSVVWGSQAIGGVIAVTSRELDGVRASAEYGGNDTFDAQAGAGIASAARAFSLDGGFTRTDGISAAAVGTEPDGYRQYRFGGRGRIELGGGIALVGAARYADSKTDLDGFPPPTYLVFGDTSEYQKTREASGRTGLRLRSAALDLDAGYALSDIRRSYYDAAVGPEPSYAYAGRSERAELTGEYRPAANWRIDFGADREWSRFSSTFDAEQHARLTSVHALLGFGQGAFNLAGGIRIDDHDRFGTATTLGGNGSLALGGGWRLRASYGEGFKAPTLFQLFSSFGDPALLPERSRSFDAGIERGDRNGPLHLALTAFRRDSRDLIDFVACTGEACLARPFGLYANVGRARAEGIEAEADAQVGRTLGLHAAYSYVRATNRASGSDLARRPRHALTLAADWVTPLRGLSLGADLRAVSDSFDDPANLTRIEGHALVGLRARVPLRGPVELYGRIENLANLRYQTVAGFGTAGRTATIGVRSAW